MRNAYVKFKCACSVSTLVMSSHKQYTIILRVLPKNDFQKDHLSNSLCCYNNYFKMYCVYIILYTNSNYHKIVLKLIM